MVLHAVRNRDVIGQLRAQERIYASSVNVLLLSAATAARIAAVADAVVIGSRIIEVIEAGGPPPGAAPGPELRGPRRTARWKNCTC